MSESLIIKNGLGVVKNLQVDSGSNGYISNHTVVSTVTGSQVNTYYPGNGISWGAASGTINALPFSATRKGVIINNNSETGKCYIIAGTTFGTLTNVSLAPPKYSFLLEPGGTYFGDFTTAALQHSIFVLSSSELIDSSSITVTVTEIY